MVVLYLIGVKYVFGKIFHTPNPGLVVQTSIQGYFGKLNLEITFGQIIFVRKFYNVLYTWHDHWFKSLEQGNEV